MKRVVVVAVVAAAAFLAWRHFRASGPEAVYREFAEAMLERDYTRAATLADGLSSDDLAKLGTQERIGAGPPMFQKLFPSRFNIESKTSEGDDVVIHAAQTVLFNPVGVESAMRPAMTAKMRQVATMRKVGGDWRVRQFENEFVSMGTTSKR